MNLGDLIRRFRVTASDTVQPYLWEEDDVVGWLNDAQEQAAIRGRLLFDDSTSAVCTIGLKAGTTSYALDPHVYEITRLERRPSDGSEAHVVHLVSRGWLDDNVHHWRSDTEHPMRYAVQDDTRLRVVGAFADGDKLALECYRLPLTPMENPSDEPEIHAAHHLHLIDWALYRAFSVEDADGFDPKRAEQGEADFTRYFGPPPDSDLRRETRIDVPQHNVGVLL